MGRVIGLLPLRRIEDGSARPLAIAERREVYVVARAFRGLAQQNTIHPVHDRAVQLSRSVKSQPVLVQVGNENVLDLQVAAGAEQRKRVAETFQRSGSQM